jgi:hypothetical protein
VAAAKKKSTAAGKTPGKKSTGKTIRSPSLADMLKRIGE